MTVQEKYSSFIAPANDRSLSIAFECWKADPTLNASQQPANQDWNGGALKAIPAPDGLRHVDLPALLEHLVKHCWQRASVSDPAARGRVTLGGTVHYRTDSGQRMFGGRQFAHEMLRNGNQADLRRVQARETVGAHVRQVQPLITQEAAGAAAAPMRAFPHLQGIATDWKTMDS